MPLPTPLFWRNVDSHTPPRWEGDNGGLEILGSPRPVFSGLRCHDKGSYGYLDIIREPDCLPRRSSECVPEESLR